MLLEDMSVNTGARTGRAAARPTIKRAVHFDIPAERKVKSNGGDDEYVDDPVGMEDLAEVSRLATQILMYFVF